MTTYAPPKVKPSKVRDDYRMSLSYHTPYENASYEIRTKKRLSNKQLKRWLKRIISTMPKDEDL